MCVKVIASQRWDVFLRHGVHIPLPPVLVDVFKARLGYPVPSCFFVHSCWNRTYWDKWHRCCRGWTPILSSNQASRTEENCIPYNCVHLRHTVPRVFDQLHLAIKTPEGGWRSSPCELSLDLGSSQGHISMHNTYRTTSIPNHASLALSNSEIWPFDESPVISIFRFFEVWSQVIAYWEGNSKTGLRQAED